MSPLSPSAVEQRTRELLAAMLKAQKVSPYRGWSMTDLNRAADAAREFLGLPSIRDLNPDIAKMQDAAAANGPALRAALSVPEVAQGEAAPIDMILFCPECGEQHVDEEEHVLAWTGGSVPEPSHDEVVWDNPPHRSHLCHNCGCIWRPADVATNGVAKIGTVGSADTWSAILAPAAAAQPSVRSQAVEECAKVAEAFRDPNDMDTEEGLRLNAQVSAIVSAIRSLGSNRGGEGK